MSAALISSNLVAKKALKDNSGPRKMGVKIIPRRRESVGLVAGGVILVRSLRKDALALKSEGAGRDRPAVHLYISEISVLPSHPSACHCNKCA